MKFSIMRSRLLDGLKTVQNVVSSKNPLQILQNALLEAKDNRLFITTSDVYLSIRASVECEVEEAGATTLPVKLLVNTMSKASEGKIMFSIDAEDHASISAGSASFKVTGMNVRDFPAIPQPDDAMAYTIEQCTLREMLRKTAYAVSQDETRRVLNGVLMSFKDGKLTLVSTDGRRLALVEHEAEFPVEAEKELILPTKTVQELMRTLLSDGDVKIYVQNKQIIFEMGDTMLVSNVIDGIYPNYRQVIPTKCEERIVVERELLLQAMDRVSVMTTDKVNSTRLTFSANQLIITTSSPESGIEGRDIVPIKYAGKEISVIFNPEYVMAPLRNIDDDEVILEMNDGVSPALLKCSVPFLYVMMPLRVN